MDPQTPAAPPPEQGEPDPWWPVAEGTVIATPPPPPPPVRRRGRRIAFVSVLVVGLVGAAATVMALGARADGASSPEAAVRAMFDALGNEDLAAMVATMPPGEAGPLVEAFGDAGPELRRLGLLPADFDVRSFPGIDLTFADLQFRTEELRDGLVAVHVTGGTVTAAITPDDLPVGDWLGAQIPPGMLEGLPDSSSVTESLGDDDLYLVTVEDGDAWYVSLWYTVAELARRDAGAPLPDPAQALTARGAATPEGAVEELVRAAADLDLRRVLELLPPDEAAVLHEYAPLFLDELDSATGDFDGIEITVTSLDTSATVDGSRAMVTIDGFVVDLTEPSLGETVSVAWDGDCLVVSGDFGFGFGGGDVFNTCDPGFGEFGGFEVPPALEGLQNANTAVVVVERDGSWYVSPTETLGNAIVQGLQSLDRASLDAIVDMFQGLNPAGLMLDEAAWTATY